MELDLTNASLPIYEALANETRLAILRELGDKKKSISEIGQKLAISNALMTKHIRKLEEAQLIKTEKGSGQDWKKKYLSLKLVQGLICTLITLLFLKLPFSLAEQETFFMNNTILSSKTGFLVLLIFIFTLPVIFKKLRDCF